MEPKIEERLNSLTTRLEFNSMPHRAIEEENVQLRKKRLDKEFMNKRIALSNEQLFQSEYQFKIQSLSITKQMSEKTFNSLGEFLSFISDLLQENNPDDYIAFALILLKTYKTIDDDKALAKYNLPSLLLNHLQKKLSNIVFINELIWTLINLSYSSNENISTFLATEKHLVAYKAILIKYHDEPIIKRNVLQLFGNLVSGHFKNQKAFYESKLYDLIYSNLKAIPIGAISIEKDLMLWFLSCFSSNIIKNVHFRDNKLLIISIQSIFIENMHTDAYIDNCLLGLKNTSEFEFSEIIAMFFADNGKMIQFLFGLPFKHYPSVNVIICNLSSVDEAKDDKLVQYGLLDFIKKGLESQSDSIKSEIMWTLANVCTNTKIVQMINDKGLILTVLSHAKSYSKLLVISSLEVIHNIITESSLDFADIMHQHGVIDVLLELLSKKQGEKMLTSALKGLSLLLQKYCSNCLNAKFIDDFEQKGGRDLLISLSSSDIPKLAEMASQLLGNYYNKDYDSKMIN